MFQLIYPTHGRGAWSSAGGTLSADGTRAGVYYRSPVGPTQMPGIAGYRALKNDAPVDIDSYAIFMGVKSIQYELGVEQDGLFGPATAAHLQSWQVRHSLEPDGIFGKASSRAMFRPIAANTARSVSSNASVAKLTFGHIGYESDWDPGAVGYVQPRDLGLGQINGPAHPDLTANFRLSARPSISFIANFVLNNLESMAWKERDAIAAYNLGVGGARNWVHAGRPDTFNGVDVAGYIAGVLANVN